MSTAVGRDHVVNRVNGNPHPFAIHFDFVVVLNHSTLGRATIQQVAARTFAVISLELRVEILMPVTVAHPVTSVLCLCAPRLEAATGLKNNTRRSRRVAASECLRVTLATRSLPMRPDGGRSSVAISCGEMAAPVHR